MINYNSFIHGQIGLQRQYKTHEDRVPIVFLAKQNPSKEEIYDLRDHHIFSSEDGTGMIFVRCSEVANVMYLLASDFDQPKELKFDIYVEGKEIAEEAFSLPEIPATEDEFAAYHQGIDLFPNLMQEALKKLFK